MRKIKKGDDVIVITGKDKGKRGTVTRVADLEHVLVEGANRVKKRNVFTQYGPVARQVLEALIDKYADQGIKTIESDDILSVPPLTTLGSPVELVRSFGGRPQFLQALQLLEREIYSAKPN